MQNKYKNNFNKFLITRKTADLSKKLLLQGLEAASFSPYAGFNLVRRNPLEYQYLISHAAYLPVFRLL